MKPAAWMPTAPDATAPPSHAPALPRTLPSLSLAALGAAFGDLGTSPLYALRVCFTGPHGVVPTPGNVLGVLSLVLWSLVAVVSVKYLAFVLRADNRGEGGVLALMALAATRSRETAGGRTWALTLVGLLGASCLFADATITPALSVLGAVEGLGAGTRALDALVVPIALVIVVLIFALQPEQTGRAGALAGPLMALWFLALAAAGAASVADAPRVLAAVDPRHGIAFFEANGARGLLVLGAVFLVVTGSEALSAHLGRFGRRSIRLAWFAVVLPALALNFLGQGALLLRDPGAAPELFFRLVPAWALYPMTALATGAAVLASRTVASACFSLTRQATQLGLWPRVRIVHTSSHEIGRVFVPGVNVTLLLASAALVLGFRSSGALAAAYGLALALTMLTTTLLFHAVARTRRGWSAWGAGALLAAFVALDAAFVGANLAKFADGAWVAILGGAGVFTLLTTWKRGREILAERLRHEALPLDLFLADVKDQRAFRVPGFAVFMSANPHGVPHALLHNLKHNKVLHERNVLLTIVAAEAPHVDAPERLTYVDLGQGFVRLTAHYGFLEAPSVPEILVQAREKGLEASLHRTTFFLGRETIIATRPRGMALWRERLFAAMALNARSPTAYFDLPPNRVVELGAQIEL